MEMKFGRKFLLSFAQLSMLDMLEISHVFTFGTLYSRYGHQNEIWNLLKTSLQEWKLPETESEKQLTDEAAQDGANAQVCRSN